MENLKDIRWKQRFENFSKSYKLLKKYSEIEIKSELEIAGIIQLFEVSFELSWKVLKDYLEADGYLVKSPRETLKQAFQIGIIENGHVWIDALASRNLTTYTYDEEFANKMLKEIVKVYIPEIDKLYNKLKEEC
ncbi:MAG: nucleotidyltransferase substrate binding protein [Sarcina sp.]